MPRNFFVPGFRPEESLFVCLYLQFMNPEQLKFSIGITLINGIGNNIAKNLISTLGNEEAVFKEKKKNLEKIPGIGEKLAFQINQHGDVLQRAEAEVEFILKNKISYFHYADNQYPFRLKECPDAPLLLYFKGNTDINTVKIIGIVGTRSPTDYGKQLCRDFIRELRDIPGVLIISGLAYGVDICAHKASLENDIPTLGVVAHGLDMIYPRIHRNTAVKMIETGGLITEYISKTNPDRQNFVQRNRIIAGMSDAVIVIESAEKGGALLTADFAQDYNRDIFAFPGRVGDAFSKGCNQLIAEQKASLIENASDFVRLMGWEERTKNPEKQLFIFNELNEDEQLIYALLKNNYNGVHVNSLSLEMGIAYSKLTSILLAMEFKSLIRALPGGVYKAI